MKFDYNQTYWVLMAHMKYSGVPWYVRNSGLPGAGRTTAIHDAKRFASRAEAIEWGNHLTFDVLIRKVTEETTFTLTEEK